MTATKFFQMCRERDVEINTLISMYHPRGYLYDGVDSPRYAFRHAVHSLDYRLAERVLKETRNHVPKNTVGYTRLSELLEETTVKKINKYYVCATSISNAIEKGHNADWTRPTLDEAVQHAKEIIEKEDRDTVAIVEIIMIVRRAKQPVTVEVV